MIRLVLALLLLALPAAAQQADVEDGLSMMATDPGEGYAEVLPGTPISFPADHGPHPGFRIEWWYITSNLEDEAGTPLGIQWTLFRFATRPGGEMEAGWATPQIWMGHAAITTADTHLAAERLARGGIGQAGAVAEPFRAWIDDWAMESVGSPYAPLTLIARGEGFSYTLTLTEDGPWVLQGDRGYSAKSERGQASHYTSQPFFRVEGTVEIGGKARAVTGQAWMDREWSSQPLAEGQTGWDWLSLHLSEGEKLMVYRLRDNVGGDYITGNWITPDGTSSRLAPGEIAMEPLRWVEVAGRETPVAWRVEIPDRALAIETEPLNEQAWNALSTSYWEGPVFFEGTHEGRGYLEMTGY
ncbi:MAG: lipocalin-like domain-containing protein [Pseudomonadota bacterium]